MEFVLRLNLSKSLISILTMKKSINRKARGRSKGRSDTDSKYKCNTLTVGKGVRMG